MTLIRKINDVNGNQVYPQTHEKAVIDSDGVNLEDKLDALQELYEGLTQSDIVVTDDHTDISSPEANTIYREQGESSYTDWMYYDGAWKKMAEYDNATDDEPIQDSENLVKSGGVYDFFTSRFQLKTEEEIEAMITHETWEPDVIYYSEES